MGASLVNSFDVFDTAIVRRIAHPDHLFWLVGRRLESLGLTSCAEETFRSLRMRAETDCRAGGHEPDLVEIYRSLEDLMRWQPDVTRRAMAIELEEEAKSIVPVASIKSRYDTARGQQGEPIFISDTYFKKPDVLRFLRLCGYDVDHPDVHASCDYGQSKRVGTLFGMVVDSRLRSRGNMHHIGDNRISDWRNARRAGLEATWIRHTALDRYEEAMRRGGRDDLEGSLVVGAARAARLSVETAEPPAVWVIGTSVAGPLLTSFVLWTLVEAKRNGLDKLYFLARDGQVMVKLADRLSRWAGLGIECRYLLASRQALFLASLPLEPSMAMASALAQGAGKTIAAFLHELEFGSAQIANILVQTGHDAAHVLSGSEEELRRLQGAVQALGYSESLRDTIVLRTNALTSYLDDEGFLDASPKAIVDLGWRGNLQVRLDKCLAKLGRSPTFGFYYSLCARPTSIATRVDTYTQDSIYNPHLLEAFCLADHASIRGFDFDASNKAVGLGVLEADRDALDWGVGSQQAAMMSFCAHLVDGLDPTLVTAEALLTALRRAAQSAFELFIRRPRPDEAHAYGGVLHASDQAHLETRELAPMLKGFDLLMALFNPRMRRDLSKWAGGTIARSTRPMTARALSKATALQWRVMAAARTLAKLMSGQTGAAA